MSTERSRRFPPCTLLACLLCAAPLGCANRAKNDIYQQRLASEIRVLEDQLYDADYQNRVLREQLERCQRAPESARIPTPKPPLEADQPSPAAPLKPPATGRSKPAATNPEMEHGFESDSLEMPSFDEGIPVDPDALVDPQPSVPNDSFTPRGQSPESTPPGTATPRVPAQPKASESDLILPAPGGPVPPGKRDTEIPQIEPGEILPPPIGEEDTLKPPGQIQLPDSIQASEGTPKKLRLHPSLSGGHRVGEQIDGMVIVTNVLDELGRTVDLSGFDIDAEMSIVILDPRRSAAEGRIGRWDFTPQQVKSFVRDEPISGLHVPITWDTVSPSGEEVIVHVRLRSEGDEMRCEGRIKLDKQTAITEWTPRGEKLR